MTLKKELENRYYHGFKNMKATANCKKLLGCITRAAEKHCTKTNPGQNFKGNPWWNVECSNASEEKKKLRRRMFIEKNAESYEKYDKQRKQLKNTIRKAKIKHTPTK